MKQLQLQLKKGLEKTDDSENKELVKQQVQEGLQTQLDSLTEKITAQEKANVQILGQQIQAQVDHRFEEIIRRIDAQASAKKCCPIM